MQSQGGCPIAALCATAICACCRSTVCHADTSFGCGGCPECTALLTGLGLRRTPSRCRYLTGLNAAAEQHLGAARPGCRCRPGCTRRPARAPPAARRRRRPARPPRRASGPPPRPPRPRSWLPASGVRSRGAPARQITCRGSQKLHDARAACSQPEVGALLEWRRLCSGAAPSEPTSAGGLSINASNLLTVYPGPQARKRPDL